MELSSVQQSKSVSTVKKISLDAEQIIDGPQMFVSLKLYLEMFEKDMKLTTNHHW